MSEGIRIFVPLAESELIGSGAKLQVKPPSWPTWYSVRPRFLVSKSGFHLETAYRPVIAIVHLYWMRYAIEPPGLPFNFRFQKGLRVNPVMDRLPVFHGQLELISVAVLNLLHPDQFELGALGYLTSSSP